MSRTSRRDERLTELAVLMEKQGVMRLRDAAAQLGVSEMTIRRDMAQRDLNGGDLTRSDSDVLKGLNCLGGYIFSAQDNNGHSDYSLDHESDCHAGAKAQACAEAAAMIEEHDTIFIDCGTTTPHLARLVPENKSVTVVCYSLNVAEILSAREDVRLIVLGGLFHRSAASFSGEEGIETLKKIIINKAFISAGGVHDEHGVTCSHFHEIPVKQMAIARAMDSYLVVDSSKFGKVRSAPFAQITQFRRIFSA
ncbi:DeoR/GlpR family DNA-binding transcription regulator [Ochrobactrum sp. SFR4]|uniref:DeoR/GlpR family DNA-binding transcription regulator n=1 Tax=Ochrobactrum sp. SFR4 TaxID=2717368 RepID=UPI000EFB4174|nr:DeoR/GlpR family DNA-binding transcription regulator [Ochrobactrum sp. SFR4]MBX8826589.1 DeoR/GlpR transcriptional regulator [Ochrobactrum sp. SFR4]